MADELLEFPKLLFLLIYFYFFFICICCFNSSNLSRCVKQAIPIFMTTLPISYDCLALLLASSFLIYKNNINN